MAVNNESKLWAFVGYLGVLCLLPLLLKKDDSFAQFHAKQGLVMLIVWVALGFLSFPIGLISLIPVIGMILGGLLGLALGIIWIVVIIVWIIAIVKVIQGQTWRIPFVSNFAERIKF